MEPAGVLPPLTAPTLTGSGGGAIVGTYHAYVRFLDRYGFVSNFSPVSAEFEPVGLSGLISAASLGTPIVVTTSVPHTLLTGATVKIEGVGGATQTNGTFTITVLSATTFSLDDSIPGLTPYSGGGTWVTGVLSVTYTNVAVPVEPKVVRKQILRNTDGQLDTFYVDVDTEDLQGTTFISTRVDTELADQESQPISDESGNDLANQYTVPPDYKLVFAHHLGRMFAAAEVEYSEGSVKVSFGSTTVTGIQTEWTDAAAGRFLYVVGAVKPYEILSVDTTLQTLTLTEAYQGSTNPYAPYSLRPPPAQRRTVPFSEAALPEAWPAFNALTIAENGDTITGLMQFGSFLYILERRHCHKFTFHTIPRDDGFIFLAANRGCINNRCWVVADGRAYMLDEGGVHGFPGGEDNAQVSTPIQNLFRDRDFPLRINWDASRYFHAIHYPQQETIRWFISLAGSYLPRHALAYAYKTQRWWIEEYSRPISSSTLGKFARQANLATWGVGTEQPFLGTDSRKILALGSPDKQTLDGVDPRSGQTRGTATSATILTLTDTQNTWPPEDNLINAPVVIVSGKGVGQQRRIVDVEDGNTLRLDRPWLIVPDDTSIYQLGGISWEYQTGWFNLTEEEESNPRGVTVTYRPTVDPSELRLRVFLDRSEEAESFGSAYGESIPDPEDLVFDMQSDSPRFQKRTDGSSEIYAGGAEVVSYQLSGVQGKDRVVIYGLEVDGVDGQGG